MGSMWIFFFSCKQFKEQFGNARRKKVKEMQPMRLCIYSYRQIEDSSKNSHSRKIIQMQQWFQVGFCGVWLQVGFQASRLVFFLVSIRAERRRREVRRWEHLKMYPPDCILAPRSRQALPFGLVMMMMPMMKMLKMMAMMMMPMLMIKMIKMMAMMMMNMIVFLRMPLHQTPVAPFLDFVFHLPQKNSFNLKFHL